MSVVVFQHESKETPAVLGATLRDHGHALRVVALYAGDAVPADLDDVHAVVSMGGSANVDQGNVFRWIGPEMEFLKRAHEAALPVIGICLGAQLIAAALGGEVGAMTAPEAGWHQVTLSFPGTTDPVLTGLPAAAMQFHLHGQEVKKLPPGSAPLAASKLCRTQAFRAGFRTYGFQYHFEWTRADIGAVASDQLFPQAGLTKRQLQEQTQQHYRQYRRLGDRLCHNIATYLLPLDKRVVA